MQDRQAQGRDVMEAVLVDAMRRMTDADFLTFMASQIGAGASESRLTDYAAERMRLIAMHLEADEAREQDE